MTDALAAIREKLKRADKHILKLGAKVEAFLNEAPNRTLVDYDAESAEAFKCFHQNRVIPLCFGVITGEVVYQLRSSLDHMVNALIIRDGGSPTDTSQFPILRYKPRKQDEIRRYEGQIKGIANPEALAIIEASQPYTRGEGRFRHWLSVLKTFSNTDKHRSLVMHVIDVQPRISFTTVFPGSSLDIETDALDDGTQVATSHVIDGEMIEVTNQQRRLTTHVAFDQFGAVPFRIQITYGLRGRFHGSSAFTGRGNFAKGANSGKPSVRNRRLTADRIHCPTVIPSSCAKVER